MTDESALRLAEAMNRLAGVLELHLTPKPIRRNRCRHERRELDQWIATDAWPDRDREAD